MQLHNPVNGMFEALGSVRALTKQAIDLNRRIAAIQAGSPELGDLRQDEQSLLTDLARTLEDLTEATGRTSVHDLAIDLRAARTAHYLTLTGTAASPQTASSVLI